MTDVAAIVLCGGTSRRFGGIDKTNQPFGAATVLDHLLTQLPAEWPVACVGEPREVVRPVGRALVWTREEPIFAGPVAGIAAGLAAHTADMPIVVVLAGDQPFAGEVALDLVTALRTADPSIDGVAAQQGDGRPQLLLAAYRRNPLTALLTGDLTDAGVYRTLAPLRLASVPVQARATLDVDAPADLERARDVQRGQTEAAAGG